MKFINARRKARYQLHVLCSTVEPVVPIVVNCTKQNMYHEAFCQLLRVEGGKTPHLTCFGDFSSI